MCGRKEVRSLWPCRLLGLLLGLLWLLLLLWWWLLLGIVRLTVTGRHSVRVVRRGRVHEKRGREKELVEDEMFVKGVSSARWQSRQSACGGRKKKRRVANRERRKREGL